MTPELVEWTRVEGREEAAERLNGHIVPVLDPTVTRPTVAVDAETGAPILAYVPIDRDVVADLRRSCLRTHMGETLRQSTGLRNRSRVFGNAPRKIYQKRESCRTTGLATDDPELHAHFVVAADYLGQLLDELLPAASVEARSAVADVLPEWRMTPNVPWTSGIINETSTLPYHFDGLNFPDSWAAMPTLRRGVEGGHLHLPEYDEVVECRDGWALFFPGLRILHGVTPITRTAADGYRYTIVYYALRGMKDCATFAMEQAEGRKRRTEREVGIRENDRELALDPHADAFRADES